MRILIAEGPKSLTETVRSAFRAEGLATTFARSFTEARRILCDKPGYDLLVLDLDLPDLGGMPGVVAALQGLHPNRVALMIQLLQRDMADQIHALGLAGVLPKQLPPLSLARALRFMVPDDRA